MRPTWNDTLYRLYEQFGGTYFGTADPEELAELTRRRERALTEQADLIFRHMLCLMDLAVETRAAVTAYRML